MLGWFGLKSLPFYRKCHAKVLCAECLSRLIQRGTAEESRFCSPKGLKIHRHWWEPRPTFDLWHRLPIFNSSGWQDWTSVTPRLSHWPSNQFISCSCTQGWLLLLICHNIYCWGSHHCWSNYQIIVVKLEQDFTNSANSNLAAPSQDAWWPCLQFKPQKDAVHVGNSAFKIHRCKYYGRPDRCLLSWYHWQCQSGDISDIGRRN